MCLFIRRRVSTRSVGRHTIASPCMHNSRVIEVGHSASPDQGSRLDTIMSNTTMSNTTLSRPINTVDIPRPIANYLYLSVCMYCKVPCCRKILMLPETRFSYTMIIISANYNHIKPRSLHELKEACFTCKRISD